YGEDVGGVEPAFMAAIEDIAFCLDAREQILPSPAGFGCVSGFGSLVEIEYRPVVGGKGSRRARFGARDLNQMADMADSQAASRGAAGIVHVDRDGARDSAPRYRL